MRYALVSDIHANQQAWEAVSKDIDQVGVDQVICLGDIVGYGPAPVRVLESVYAKSTHFVLGNHDAVVGGRLDPEFFYDEARFIIEWTQKNLNKFARDFFAEVPMIVQDDAFLCVHAEAAVPDRYDYIFEPHEAVESFAACEQQLIFVGHTHCPCVMLKQEDADPVYRAGNDFNLQDECRYLVNVGSVGDPRDGDTRASYAILDLAAKSVQFRKVDFDIEGFRRDLEKSKLPSKPVLFDFVDTPSNPSSQTQKILSEFQPISLNDIDDEELNTGQKVAKLSGAGRKKTVSIKVNRKSGDALFGKPAAPFEASRSAGAKKRRNILIGAGALVLLALVGGVALMGHLGKENEGTTGGGPGGQEEQRPEQADPGVSGVSGTLDALFKTDGFKNPPPAQKQYEASWPEGLVSHFKLDEGSTAVVSDSADPKRAGALRAPHWSTGVIGRGLHFDGKQSLVAFPSDAFTLNEKTPFSMMLWLLASKQTRGPVVEQIDPDQAYRGFQMMVDRNHLKLQMAHKWPDQSIVLRSVEPLNFGDRIAARPKANTGAAAGAKLDLGSAFTFG
ncbi:MAG: metallophosphoesterase family protein, partial [Verrucomicrobiota bacterium]